MPAHFPFTFTYPSPSLQPTPHDRRPAGALPIPAWYVGAIWPLVLIHAATSLAVARLKEVIQLRPTFADAHFRLALVFWHLGRPEEAVAERHEALRLDPSLPP